MRVTPLPLALFVLLVAMPAARAEESCTCRVSVGNQNRRIWGSWALECNGHGGHGDCPSSNIDVLHSPGAGALVGQMIVETRVDGALLSGWTKEFGDDHVTAFKGPVWWEGHWEWTNVCSCDGYADASPCRMGQWDDPNRAMYAGAQVSPEYVFQGAPPPLTLPHACGDPRSRITVREQMEENDPWTPNDALGEISASLVPMPGQSRSVIWAEHFEPAHVEGRRTHAGFSGGSFGAEIVVFTDCRTAAQRGKPAAHAKKPQLVIDGAMEKRAADERAGASSPAYRKERAAVRATARSGAGHTPRSSEMPTATASAKAAEGATLAQRSSAWGPLMYIATTTRR
jgi:hypothetical protein